MRDGKDCSKFELKNFEVNPDDITKGRGQKLADK